MTEREDKRWEKNILAQVEAELADPLQILTSTRESLEIELRRQSVSEETFERYLELQGLAIDRIRSVTGRWVKKEDSTSEPSYELSKMKFDSKVLLVDSNEDTLASTMALFEVLGATVRGAISAQEAFIILSRESELDLILADENIQDMDGIQFLQEAEEHYGFRGQRVLLRWGQRVRKEKTDFDGLVLYKPFGQREILGLLSQPS